MRDAFGGAFLIKLLLIFLSFYIAFMAVALNYARAFRTKNGIIDIIEQYEGFHNDSPVSSKNQIDVYLSQFASFKQTGLSSDVTKHIYCDSDYGYCVQAFSDNHYKVTTHMSFELPIMNLHLNVPISGETKIVTNNSSCIDIIENKINCG